MNTRRMHGTQLPICAVITGIETHCPEQAVDIRQLVKNGSQGS